MISAIETARPAFGGVTYDDVLASFPDAEHALGVIALLSSANAAASCTHAASSDDSDDVDDLDVQISFVIDTVLKLARGMHEFHSAGLLPAFTAEAVRLALLIAAREAIAESEIAPFAPPFDASARLDRDLRAA